MEATLIVTAFGFGFAARAVGLPPLVGYLAAGFVLHALGYETSETIETISDLGVLLLLFGIGLKLRLRTLIRPEVWVTATAMATVTTVIGGGVLLGLGAMGVPLVDELGLGAAAILGFAFSFSSTVFAVKVLDRGNESASLAGRLAIGILILQDILAVGFLVATGDGWPSPWALLLVPGFFVLRPVFGWLLDRSDHGEVLVLLGFALAVGIGAEVFDLVGLKPDLGALVAGLALSGHPRSGEMADRLLDFKDLFLVGFFLSIGLGGVPSPAGWAIGLLALVLVPARGVAMVWILTRFRLRARTAFHTSLTLSTNSEFGLIVASAALAAGLLDQAWLAVVAVAVSVSFVVASLADSVRYRLYELWSDRLAPFERHPTTEEDAILDCGIARTLVFGMGRVGTGTYDELISRSDGPVVGIDRSAETVAAQEEEGRRAIRGDALDLDFWERVRFHPEVELVVLAMNSHRANLEAVRRVREFLPEAHIAAIATYPDQVTELREAGVDVARNLYEEAGQALADDAVITISEMKD